MNKIFLLAVCLCVGIASAQIEENQIDARQAGARPLAQLIATLIRPVLSNLISGAAGALNRTEVENSLSRSPQLDAFLVKEPGQQPFVLLKNRQIENAPLHSEAPVAAPSSKWIVKIPPRNQ